MIDLLRKKYANTILKPYLLWYLKKPRTTTVKGLKLLIKPTVFHPKFFFSSQYLFDFVSKIELNKKSFLEIGCGSGLISILAHQKKAIVTCCDINDIAIECTKYNFDMNFKDEKENFLCFKSNVFDQILKTTFDFIAINPPYFFSDVKNENQLAWNCGVNGEYFEKLFSQLQNYIHKQSCVYMILADNCEIERINNMAKQHHFQLILVDERKINWEKNYIFKISITN